MWLIIFDTNRKCARRQMRGVPIITNTYRDNTSCPQHEISNLWELCRLQIQLTTSNAIRMLIRALETRRRADSLRAISSHKRIKIIIGRLCRTARNFKFQSAPNDGPFAVVTVTNGFPAFTAKILAAPSPFSTPFNRDIPTWDYARLRAAVDRL